MTSPRGLEPTERQARVVVAVITLAAAALYLRGFAAGRTLWADEASLALNFFDRGWFSSPSNEQVAPLGYMVAVQTCIALLGGVSVTALRLVSLLAALAAIPLVYVAARNMAGRWAGLGATALFAMAPSLVYYSGEHKQYATEVFVSALLLVVATNACLTPKDNWRLAWLSTVAALAMWFSLPAVFVVVGLFVALLSVHVSQGGVGRVVLAGLAPALSFVASQVWLRARIETGYYQAFWADVYPTFDAGLIPGLLSWGRQAVGMFGGPLVPPVIYLTPVDPARVLPNVMAPLALAGLIALVGRRPWAAALVAGWLAAAVGAVALHAYPFAGRLSLYALPLTCTVAAAWLSVPTTLRGRMAAVTVFVVMALSLPAWMAATVARRPTEREELRQVIARMSPLLAPDDVVYLYNRAWRQFEVYRRIGLPTEWRRVAIVAASPDAAAEPARRAEWSADDYSRGEVLTAAADIRRLAAGPGKVWAIFSHYAHAVDERRAVLDQLAPDHRVLKSIEAIGAAADLID